MKTQYIMVEITTTKPLNQNKMLLDNEGKKQNIWWISFLYGTLIGIFAGIAISHLIFI